MISTFREDGSAATLFRFALEAGLFFLISLIVIHAGHAPHAITSLDFVIPALVFAAVTVLANTLVGIYDRVGPFTLSGFVARLLPALFVGLPAAYVAFLVIPHANSEWQTPRVLVSMVVLVLLRQSILMAIGTRLAVRRVLVLGQGPAARAVGSALGESGRAAELVGYYPIGSTEEVAVPGHLIVAAGASLEAVIERERIDEVIVAVREQRGGSLPLAGLLNCRLRGVRISDHTQFFERVRGEVPVASLKASFLIFSDGFRQNLMRALMKRSFDLAVAVILLILTSPIMLVTALLIALESPGGVIYSQERVGRGGRVFRVLKFRSMRSDAEKDGSPQWARKSDPRITRIGRFIRATRIDELPQLINVLRNEMSIVGPRPERPFFVEQLAERIPFYAARHSVLPGITGWAQVRYEYGASVEDAQRKLQFDLYYVKNHTFLLDLVILFETIQVVLFSRGAR